MHRYFMLGMLRRELRRWLDADVTEHVAGDIILTAYEAIAEIVTLADPLDAGLIRMQAHLDDDQVRVVIAEYRQLGGVPSDPDQTQRRLTLIRALTDHASFHREEGDHHRAPHHLPIIITPRQAMGK